MGFAKPGVEPRPGDFGGEGERYDGDWLVVTVDGREKTMLDAGDARSLGVVGRETGLTGAGEYEVGRAEGGSDLDSCAAVYDTLEGENAGVLAADWRKVSLRGIVGTV